MKKIIFAAVAVIFMAAAVVSVKEIVHGKRILESVTMQKS